MSVQEIVSITKDILSIISGIILTVIAILGLQTWKRQLKGNAEFTAARNLLQAVYKVREGIQHVRYPFFSNAERIAALAEKNITINPKDHEWEYVSTQALYEIRIRKLSEAMSELQLNSIEAQALWGEEVEFALSYIKTSATKLLFSIKRHIENIDNKKPNTDQLDKIISALDTMKDSDNEFSVEIRDAVKKVEDFLKPKIKL